ncbi:hypothetical protein K439DRAFT_1406361 [Ramaria rubella]|nr:hypothetical protein K439DRAFT_1406361 [Ramaria rubella]
MQLVALLSLLAILQSTKSHDDHGPNDGEESNEQYAARHMSSEHHIDSFDVKSFFHLHDLNRDGKWDREEIEAIYGVHHVYSQKHSADDKAHQAKADTIVKTVLDNVDKNHDGKITPDELEAVGLDLLPNFKQLGAEGHHYDVESEFFLHHEEQFHSTPDTQTDEAYNHPEDLEHFAMHEAIEAEEKARERLFQGISEDPHGSQSADDQPAPASHESVPEAGHVDHPHDDQNVFGIPERPVSEPHTIPSRETPPEKQPPEIRYGKAATEGRNKDEWGQGSDGYKSPRTPADKMRKNLPYKYKFRRNWGDF